MTDDQIKKVGYEPIAQAWKIIRMTQNLTQNDEKGWADYVKAHDDFCKKYEGQYGHYLAMAIMAVVDDIKDYNLKEELLSN